MKKYIYVIAYRPLVCVGQDYVAFESIQIRAMDIEHAYDVGLAEGLEVYGTFLNDYVHEVEN